MIKELAAESIGMFIGEQRLTMAVLLVVAVTGSLVVFTSLSPLVAGAVLLLGNLALLVDSVCRGARPAVTRGRAP